MEEMYYHKPNINIKDSVKNIFNTMKQENLIESQDSFSKLILNKSKHYYSAVLAKKNVSFSINALSNLISQLGFLQREHRNNPQIDKLYENAVKCLDKRIRDIHIPCHNLQIRLPLKD